MSKATFAKAPGRILSKAVTVKPTLSGSCAAYLQRKRSKEMFTGEFHSNKFKYNCRLPYLMHFESELPYYVKTNSNDFAST